MKKLLILLLVVAVPVFSVAQRKFVFFAQEFHLRLFSLIRERQIVYEERRNARNSSYTRLHSSLQFEKVINLSCQEVFSCLPSAKKHICTANSLKPSKLTKVRGRTTRQPRGKSSAARRLKRDS